MGLSVAAVVPEVAVWCLSLDQKFVFEDECTSLPPTPAVPFLKATNVSLELACLASLL
jgi:hypothetical protein